MSIMCYYSKLKIIGVTKRVLERCCEAFPTGDNSIGLRHLHSCLAPLLTNPEHLSVKLVLFRDAICSHEKRVFPDEELIGP